MNLQKVSSATTSPSAKTGQLRPIRVMVVDDSAVIRGMTSRILEPHSDISVVATVSNGEQAVRRVAKKDIDVVILDVEMPVMDGLTALPLMLKEDPDLKIIMASALTQPNARVSMKALREGAADYIPKPSTGVNLSAEDFKRDLVEKVKVLGQAGRERPVPVGTPTTSRGAIPQSKEPGVVTLRKASMKRPSALAVGSSTGGPNALFRFFSALDKKSINVPIFLTQHMPPTFTGILAENLTGSTGWKVHEAKDRQVIVPGEVFLAPGDRHLTLISSKSTVSVELNDGAKENFCRPAVDPMLRSILKVYGGNVLTTILTGMGADGLAGCKQVVEMGGTVIAQDQDSSVVWGMPGAVAKNGVCSELLPPEGLAGFINRYFRGATS